MIMKQNKGNVSFRVIFKKPFKVKTLKEYERSKEVIQKKKLILKDTDEKLLFMPGDSSKK